MKEINIDHIADKMESLINRLYPICRSITGAGLRDTLNVIKSHIPLQIHEVGSGKKVFDWTVPKEWNIKDAYIKNSKGERVVDFSKSNLHVMGYSLPVHKKMSLYELKEHLHTLPDNPEWIPYRTSYYKEDWGFCLSHKQMTGLPEDTYEVCIDSSLEDGHLTYGEYYIQGRRSDEVLLSCHICHPSLCNDNVSGMSLAVLLGQYLSAMDPQYSYRIIFIPATIGAITWLALNESGAAKVKHGLVITNVGDPGRSTYKRSRTGNAEIDKAAEIVLKHSGSPYGIEDFSPYGYDERQYCSPGFNMPVGCLQRTPHGKYPEYHTSADNCQFVKKESMADSFMKYVSIVDVIENNKSYVNTNPKCEPQLGKRGLYNMIGGKSHQIIDQMSILWVLNLSDGKHSLLDIAERAEKSFEDIMNAAGALVKCGLLRECDE